MTDESTPLIDDNNGDDAEGRGRLAVEPIEIQEDGLRPVRDRCRVGAPPCRVK